MLKHSNIYLKQGGLNLNIQENSFNAAKISYNALEDKKAIDITVLNISEVSDIADYFVIASATNANQLKAMADNVEEILAKNIGLKLKHIEGVQTKSWILMDFGDLVIHLFDEKDRAFYNLERIWGDAKFVDAEQLNS